MKGGKLLFRGHFSQKKMLLLPLETLFRCTDVILVRSEFDFLLLLFETTIIY